MTANRDRPGLKLRTIEFSGRRDPKDDAVMVAWPGEQLDAHDEQIFEPVLSAQDPGRLFAGGVP